MHDLESEYILSRFKEPKLLSDSSDAKIYMVLDTTTNRPYIQKIFPKDTNMDIYRQMQSLVPKNIPKIHHVIEGGTNNYVIEEYISGTRLDELIGNQGKLDVEQVIAWISSLCDTLKQLHDASPPIIHRDIKPSNIIITDDGTPKLIDFNISRNYKNDGSTDTKTLGTEYYAAPEQFGFSQTDKRTDIYAIGKLMITLLTGKQQKPEDGIVSCSSLKSIIEKCCALDPLQRYQNVSELKRALLQTKRSHFKWVAYGLAACILMTLCYFVYQYFGEFSYVPLMYEAKTSAPTSNIKDGLAMQGQIAEHIPEIETDNTFEYESEPVTTLLPTPESSALPSVEQSPESTSVSATTPTTEPEPEPEAEPEVESKTEPLLSDMTYSSEATFNPSTPTEATNDGGAINEPASTNIVKYIDGNIGASKLDNVTDMVVDNNNNIYILDAYNRKIVRFNAATDMLETYQEISVDFDWQYDSDSSYTNRYFTNTEFTPMKLTYNKESDKLYVAGVFCEVNKWPNEGTGLFALYEIADAVDIVSFGEVVYPYTDSINHQIRSITFFNSSQFYLLTNKAIFKGSIGQTINSLSNYGILLFDNYSTGVVADETNVHIMMQKWITNEQISPRNSDKIELGNSFEALTDYQGNFYGICDNAIYEISTAGRIKPYIQLTEAAYGILSGARVTIMLFDREGNIILYDERSNSIFVITPKV